MAALLVSSALAPPVGVTPAWFLPVFWLTASVSALAASLHARRRPPARGVFPHFGLLAVLVLVADGRGAVVVALGLLPVVWLALYASRCALVLGLPAGTLLVVRAGTGPRTALWAVVIVVVALAVQNAIEQAAQRADVLAEREHALRSVATLARRTVSVPGARRAICEAAAGAARADLAYLLEPGSGGGWTSTASSRDLPAVKIEPGELGRGLVVPGPDLTATGAAVLAVQPVCRDGRAVAVLVVGWGDAEAGPHALDALDLVADEAAATLARAELLEDLAAEARHDPLTGLANRRAWDEHLSREPARARRQRQPVTVALLDLDRFKHYNDRHGHQAGDRLLKEAAAAWRGELRATDLLARWGGEEFAVLLPGCSPAEALPLVEHLRSLTPGGQTCSAGIAGWTPGESADAVLARADAALYRAKRAGRDQAVIASAPGLVVDLTDAAPRTGVSR